MQKGEVFTDFYTDFLVSAGKAKISQDRYQFELRNKVRVLGMVEPEEPHQGQPETQRRPILLPMPVRVREINKLPASVVRGYSDAH